MTTLPDPDDDPDLYADLVDEEIRERKAAQTAEWARRAIVALAALPRSEALLYLQALRVEALDRQNALGRVFVAAVDQQIQQLLPRGPRA